MDEKNRNESFTVKGGAFANVARVKIIYRLWKQQQECNLSFISNVNVASLWRHAY